MARITVKGTPVQTAGELPLVGDLAPDFRLTRRNLTDVTLRDYRGRKLLVSVVTSLDTSLCATSTRRFNQDAVGIDNATVLVVSNDLPFAQSRFCETSGIENAETLSQLRDRSFGRTWGMEMVSGPSAGLLARSVIVVDSHGRVTYTQQVPENSDEPDYARALEALRAAD